ncbi:septal ring factor EnvC (AmiA/AmiB activator) [Rhodoblastus acidophilus]|uniref:hypothetical protein n=1 Tax=Rhodoblastus acidophilus TaxID=1074 RepID=UPI002224B7D2|nr:hypothetical protein [Rhodoblastus acidophilus]MCW2284642.1 septal ring factor EnvC (AmiA/AmiB activator) [Rhodoblastus acidophilus]MCW2333595.1 septal ring factor EnvC (AmiA/AmiB activator) [Rhodoblastus acidophilus]
MRQRHKSLNRLLQVKKQLHQKEEAELAEIQRKKSEIEAERREVFEILGARDDPFILGLACRHLIQTQRREHELNEREKEQKSQLMKRTAQKKALEKIVDEAARRIAREDEKLELLEIGERLAAKAFSSVDAGSREENAQKQKLRSSLP